MVALILAATFAPLCAVAARPSAVVSGRVALQDVPVAIQHWLPFIVEASREFGVPQRWIVAVMREESGGYTLLRGRPTTSRAGAAGLMQLMPQTWSVMRERYGLGADVYDPHDNIIAGVAYLRAMYDLFGYPGMFAAYDAGPARYMAYLGEARPLPFETRAYVKRLAAATHREVDRDCAIPGGDMAADSARSARLDSRPHSAANTLFYKLDDPSGSLFVRLANEQ